MNHASNLEQRLNQLAGPGPESAVHSESGATFDAESLLEHVLSDQDLIQHVTRTVIAGGQVVTGYFRCRFQPEQQREVIHFNFTPQLNEVPQINVTMMDDVPGRVRVTHCERFGARVEVVLDQPVSAPKKVLVEIIASCSDSSH